MSFSEPLLAGSSRRNRATGTFLIFLGLLATLRLLLSASMPMSGEEAYYWMWSRQLDWCYFDHPPLISWVIRIGTAVFGHTALGVRIGALVLHVGTALLCYRLALRVFGERAVAAWAGALFTTAAFFGLTANVMIPDAPLLFFWALALCLLIEAMRPGRQRMWIAVGVALGFCALTKFHAVLLATAVGMVLVLSPAQRRHFRSGWLYLGAAVAVVMTLPIFGWNAANGWPSFGFQLSGRHKWVWGSPTYLLEMLATPFGLIGLLTYPLSIAGAIRGLREWQRRGRDDLLLLSLACLVPIVFFLVLSVFIRIDPQWAAPAYVSGVVLAAGLGVHLKRSRGGFWRKALLPAAAGSGLLVLLALSAGVVAFVQWPQLVPGKRIDILKHRGRFNSESLNQIYGWDEIGRRLEQDVADLGGRERAFIVRRGGYGTAANMQFHTPGHPRMFLLRDESARGRQFSIWERRADLSGQNAVIVLQNSRPRDLAWMQEHFLFAQEREPIEVVRAGRLRRRFAVFHGYDFR